MQFIVQFFGSQVDKRTRTKGRFANILCSRRGDWGKWDKESGEGKNKIILHKSKLSILTSKLKNSLLGQLSLPEASKSY